MCDVEKLLRNYEAFRKKVVEGRIESLTKYTDDFEKKAKSEEEDYVELMVYELTKYNFNWARVAIRLLEQAIEVIKDSKDDAEYYTTATNRMLGYLIRLLDKVSKELIEERRVI